ncbi:uncharacterized protein LOC106181344 [Lingula anatina]|uniref:Uncharacterized protein LOC106181344 n=1 Tax=Lingula anatina TaxID=7574 RepID=A0A1S3KFC0_LINAN|nr:uncharacterized protein LOC106181344 [Lingula anatina]|eukprot:XP_013421154.1 uncharacterized protein LOC106181344 [Lingula anatina]
MMIISLTLCALIFVQPTTVMISFAQENGQSAGLTQKSPNIEIWTLAGFTKETSHLRDGSQEITTEKPTSGMHGDVTQQSPTTEGVMHTGVTPQLPNIEDEIQVEVTAASTSQDNLLQGRSNNSNETSNSSDVTLTPYKWTCAISKGLHVTFKVHCNCDGQCHLYNDCCYGMTENTTLCSASARITSVHSTSLPLTLPAPNFTETQSNSTTSTASPNDPSHWIREKKQVDSLTISLALKSSCRAIPKISQAHQTMLPYMDRFGLRYWMVNQCPSSWLEEESLIKCSDITNTSLAEDVLLYQPVTDPDTMLTFKNKYCAACNGVKNGGEPWELVVYCSRALVDYLEGCSSSACVLRKLKDFGCNSIFEPKPDWNLRTCFREVEDKDFGPCVNNLNNGSVQAVPRPRPLHSALRDACMAYNNPFVIKGADNSYKNYHCMVCYRGDYRPCDQHFTRPPARELSLSFRALLYLGDQDRKQNDDPVDQQLVCPPGFAPDAQDCRPLMYNFTVVRSPVPLHFEPCGWAPTPRDGCRDIKRDGRLVAVLRAVPALFYTCSQNYGADNTSITFVVKALVTLRVKLAHLEEGRNIFDQVQAWMENALKNMQLKISGGPLGIRSGSFSACMKNVTNHDSVPPFYGATTLSTPKQNRGNSPVGNVTLLMLMALVVAVRYF